MNRTQLGTVFDKTEGKCWYCGIDLHPFSDWQVEHKQPRAKGGSDDEDNLAPACRGCNARKACRNVDEYRRAVKARLESKIGEAFEFAESLQGAHGFTFPGSLSRVIGLLDQALETATHVPILFYGENHPPPNSDDDETVDLEGTDFPV